MSLDHTTEQKADESPLTSLVLLKDMKMQQMIRLEHVSILIHVFQKIFLFFFNLNNKGITILYTDKTTKC